MSIEFFALVLGMLAIALVLGGTIFTGVPPMPTSPSVRRAMLGLSAGLTPHRVCELGAGWGGMALALARAFPDARVTAVEVSPLPWAVAKLRAALTGPPNLTVKFADGLKADLSEMDLCVCFLCPPAMERLASKLERDLKPGAYVLSNAFALPGWQPQSQARVGDMNASVVYLYRKD